MMRARMILSAALSLLVLATGPYSAFAQERSVELLNTAKDLYATAEAATGDERLWILREAEGILDQILDVAPQSDLALDILFARPINGIDVATIRSEIRAALTARGAALKAALPARPANASGSSTPVTMTVAPLAATSAAQVAGTTPGATASPSASASSATTGSTTRVEPQAQQTAQTQQPSQTRTFAQQGTGLTTFREANSQTEASLRLDRAAIRDIQSRLTALGLDPRGVDGSLGPGTRGALRSWQQANNIPVSGYLDAAQLQALRAGSQQQLDAWLRVPANARLFAPPPAVALTPSRLARNWRFTARCGANSRLPNQTITGVMAMRHAGGAQYTGAVRNSAGLNGRVAARLDGRVIHTEINWGLLFGRVRFSGTFSDDARSISGRDSNGCRVTGSAM